MNRNRHYTIIDQLILQLHAALNTVCGKSISNRPNPATHIPEPTLSIEEKKRSIGYMRVNHSGEVCAQALYRGQLTMARESKVQALLEQSAIEETDHLAWCQHRLNELGGHRSYLDPFSYSNTFFIGALAGLIGDNWSLGFVEETEKQVEAHLEGHLHKLPSRDRKSRHIVQQMQADEVRHGQNAKSSGARELPFPIKKLMRLQAKIMTTLTYWI